MKLLRKLFKRATINDPSVPINKALETYFAAPQSYSGVTVDRQSALSNPAIFRATNLISSHVAKLPLNVYRRVEDDGREKATQHPAFRLLKQQASESYSAYLFKQTLMGHCLLNGNGYAWIRRDATAKPIELLILNPEDTTPARENGNLLYVTEIDDRKYKIQASDMLHIKGLSFDGLVGYSVLDLLQNEIGHGIALQRHGSVFFKNNAKPSIVIELPASVKSPEKVEEYRRCWGQIYEGLDNSHRPALMQAGSKLVPMPVNNDEAQYIESREHDLLMVADILGVPPHKIGAKFNSSYASLESENKAFLQDCLDPWLVQWEQECHQKLLTERQKERQTHFFEFLREALIQTDTKTEIDLLLAQYHGNAISWEEMRRKLNMPTKKEGTYLIPTFVTDEEDDTEPQQEPVSKDEQDIPEDKENASDEASDALKRISEQIVSSLITRCQKSVANGKVDLQKHRPIWLNKLSIYRNSVDVVDEVLQKLEQELEAVLPEQRSTVFERLDPQTIVEDLCI